MVCALLLACNAHATDWEKLAPLPEPNGGFIGGSLDGQVYVIAGTNWEGGKKNWLSKVHSFDPKAGQWKTNYSLESPLAYAVSGLGHDGSALLIAGGFNGTAPFDKMLVLKPKTVVSADSKDPKPPALAAGGVIGSGMVIVGGTDDPANIVGLTNRAIVLGDAVEPLPDYPGKGIGSTGSAIVGKELFLFGGVHWTGTEQGVVNTDAAWALSVATKNWRRLKTFPYAVRGLTAVAITERHIYIAGGYKNDAEGFTNQAFLYDVVKDSYAPATPIPYTASVGLIICEGYLYCMGGEDKQKSRTDACYRIPVADLIK
jgi:N-acetylneuraminic acid mutarotase